MKFFKTTFIIAACAALFSSCSNEAEEVIGDDVKVDMTFGISAGNPGTRAFLPNFPDSKDIHWTETDKVSVFASGHENEMGDVFSFKSYLTEHNDATFTGKSYANAGTYYVLYPAQSAARLTANGVKFNIPAVQKATKNSFDPNACIQIGKGDISSGFLAMKNVCAFFYITVTSGCNYVDLKAESDNWHLAGTCTAGSTGTGSGGVIINNFENDCTNVIRLTDIPTEGGTFFIAFIPTSSAGSRIAVTAGYGQAAGGPMTVHFESNMQFDAGHCYDIGTIAPTPASN